MNCWLSITRSTAACTSPRIVAYCALRSSMGIVAFMALPANRPGGQRLVLEPVEAPQLVGRCHSITPAAFGASKDMRLVGAGQTPAVPSDPSILARWNAHHERIVGYAAAGDDRSRGDERVAPDCRTADDGGVGADRGAAADERLVESATAVDLATGIADVRKNAGRAAKNFVLELD